MTRTPFTQWLINNRDDLRDWWNRPSSSKNRVILVVVLVVFFTAMIVGVKSC